MKKIRLAVICVSNIIGYAMHNKSWPKSSFIRLIVTWTKRGLFVRNLRRLSTPAAYIHKFTKVGEMPFILYCLPTILLDDFALR